MKSLIKDDLVIIDRDLVSEYESIAILIVLQAITIIIDLNCYRVSIA